MKARFLILSTLLSLICCSAPALCQEDYTQAMQNQLETLRLDDAQVQGIFSVVMSQLPYMLDESVSRETLMRDVAPQLEQILRPEQRALLAEIDVSEQLVEFETMSREERTRYMFEAARGLVHPSKQEWLNRVESMTR